MASPLDGKILAVIGDPIEHSLSPVIQQAMLDALGLKDRAASMVEFAMTVPQWGSKESKTTPLTQSVTVRS